MYVDEGEGFIGMYSSFYSLRSLRTLTLSLQAKPTHQNIIRLAPPLVITEEEIQKALDIIKEAVTDLPNLKGASEDKVIPPPEKKVKIGLEN